MREGDIVYYTKVFNFASIYLQRFAAYTLLFNVKHIEDQILPRKRTRGPTQMRSVWGRRNIFSLVIRFGQTEDKNGQTLSSFIGSMVRDGKIAPLTYELWHKVPEEVKEKMWDIAKRKYNLQETSKQWTMKKFGKPLNSWRNRLKAKYYKGKEELSLVQLRELKDPRVHDEHFERAKTISDRNKVARSHRIHNHTRGTNSFARVAKDRNKNYGVSQPEWNCSSML